MKPLVFLQIVHIILILVSQAKTEDTFTEVTGSGDGDNKKTATSDVSLIDENGDISIVDGLSTVKTVIEANNENSTLVLDTTESTNESTDNFNTTTSEVGETTDSSTTTTTLSVPVTESTTKSTTEVTTESTTIAISSTTSTTTTTEATTTTTTTSTTDVTTTVKPTTKASTTTLSTTSVTQAKRNRTNTKSVPVRTTSTTTPVTNPVNRCFFLDSEFQCDEEIICYGEGEIDCTEDIDSYSSTTAFLEKASTSSVSDDYLDYEDADYNVGTFPPDLIGGNSRRKELNSFFRIPSLDALMANRNISDTDDDADVSIEEAQNATSDEIVSTSTISVTTELIDEWKSITNSTVTQGSTINFDSSSTPSSLNISTDKGINNVEMVESTTQETTVEDTEFLNETIAEQQKISNHSADLDVSDEQIDNIAGTNITDDQINIRKTREIINSSESNSSSSFFKAAALESSKKRTKTTQCRLSGNLVCSPKPTVRMCKGKTFCQAINENARAYEKSTPDSGLKKWAIAVISICAVVAAFVIVLLIYLVLTSYKKLKINPENRVTSLNFINNADP